jgi:wyosine [tRNA(Phe)-imidazoG37] synthetase (radical SAM superfamily)
MSDYFERLQSCIHALDPRGFANQIINKIESAPPQLTHRGISKDCFCLVSEWILSSDLSFNPSYMFRDLIPWSKPQFITLCGVYYWKRRELGRAACCFKAATRLSSSYQPAHYYQYLLASGKNVLSVQWQCAKPFETLDIQREHAGVCCTSWVPYSVGNPRKMNGEEIWDGEPIGLLRSSILDGSYRYCNPSYCPHLKSALENRCESHDSCHGGGKSPKYIQLSYDKSCNLSCPSCRHSHIYADGEMLDELAKIKDDVVLPLLANSSAIVSITYSGDPFASKHYRNLLRELESDIYSKVRIILATNGTLMTPDMWSELQKIWDRIKLVTISVDAATPETYSRLRPPGNWSLLIRNLKFLSTWRHQEKSRMRLVLNFCVQKANFDEMEDFLALANTLGYDEVYFQRLLNWGLFSTNQYIENDVAHPRNEYNLLFKSILTRVKARASDQRAPSIRFGVFE